MSSHITKKPTGRVPVRRIVEPPEPNEHLLERVLSRDNMQQAWKRVKANAGAAGVDNMAVDQFPTFAREHWPKIRDAASAGNYQPKPVKRVEIPKPTFWALPSKPVRSAGLMRPLKSSNDASAS